jgi:Uncharacterized protein conserved in cyanobacteria
MAVPLPYQKGTYKDWLNKQEGRWELIDGVLYNMTASPSSYHQFTQTQLLARLHAHFTAKGCSVFASPFDVFLSESEDYDTPEHVVVPDLTVICNKEQIVKKGCLGAPELVVEILSPSTAVIDFNKKYRLYERFGVKEYWIVDPIAKTVTQLQLSEGSYGEPTLFEEKDILASIQYDGLAIPLEGVFLAI